ncbi:PBECR3 domain-containing polyvalent protein, partial [Helicobacter pylori]|uniref:PBECR3 domain-containing polyvalent protein n=1 Tax=Helicobacter pylori TaxID=210 RepID=UPI001BB33B62
DIYDFTHYLLMVNREPSENNNALNRLIQAIKDMQKEKAKVKEVSKKSAEETEKGIKRDYSDTSLSTKIKELLNNAKIPTSGRDAIIFGKNNLTPKIVEFMHKNNKKMIIEKASNKEVELLQNANFRHPEDVRASLDHDAIAHILKRHGVNSVNVRNGEIPITYEDIANYRSFIDVADDIFADNNNLIAFKQINGYAVVVEQAVNRKSELVLKTMFKSNGDYKNNNAYKKFSSTGLNANAKV